MLASVKYQACLQCIVQTVAPFNKLSKVTNGPHSQRRGNNKLSIRRNIESEQETKWRRISSYNQKFGVCTSVAGNRQRLLYMQYIKRSVSLVDGRNLTLLSVQCTLPWWCACAVGVTWASCGRELGDFQHGWIYTATTVEGVRLPL